MSTADTIPYVNEYSRPTSKIEWVEYMNVKSTPNFVIEPGSLGLDLSSVLPQTVRFTTSTYSGLDEDDDFVIPFSPTKRYTVNAKITGIYRWSPKIID